MDPIEDRDPSQALLVVSFGGPENPDEVMPFLRRVTAGRDVPDTRLADVAENYLARSGVSPINGLIRGLLPGLREQLDIPVYWGNRNTAPFLVDTVAQMADDGVSSALAFVTSAFASPSGCRQYLDDIAAACAEVGPSAPHIEKLRLFHNHPGFIGPFRDGTSAAWAQLAELGADRPRLVFTAHSLPEAAAATAPYVAQLSAACAAVAPPGVGWDLVYQSRSGPPHVPWLGPDVNEHLATLAKGGIDGVVVVPIGFVMDHMEVVHDLDTVAARVAGDLNLRFVRAATPWSDPRFTDMIVELVRERTDGIPPRVLGDLGVWPDTCPAGCCAAYSVRR